MRKTFFFFVSVALLFLSALLPTGCQKGSCVPEGGSIPVVENEPDCCPGLKLIPSKSPYLVGTYGICTAKCGDDICDSETETGYNCPKDCSET